MRTLLIGNYLPDGQFSMQRYAKQLEEGLRGEDVRLDLWVPTSFFGRFIQTKQGIGKWFGYVDKYFISFTLLQLRLLFGPRYEIVHICDHSNSHYALALCRARVLVTCHDMIAVRAALGEFPQQKVGWSGRIQQRLILYGISRADSVVCISHATERDLRQILERSCPPTVVIDNAIEPEFLDGDCDISTSSKSDYILHVGSNAWYKNRPALLHLYSGLLDKKSDLLLYVVGPPFAAKELKEAGWDKAPHGIKYIENVNDRTLRQLYSDALLMIFPSVIEGFGWPIVEAQACGCPVACLRREPMSQLNALPDLLLDAEYADESHHESNISRCLKYIDLSAQERERLSSNLKIFASKFTPQHMAASVKEHYTQLSNHDL